MKKSRNKKFTLVLTIIVCGLFFATTFSGAIGKPVSNNDSGPGDLNEGQDIIENPSEDLQGSKTPLPLPPFFYQIVNPDWNFWTSSPDMYMIPSGNIGVGLTSPSVKLDVAGTVQMTGFKLPTDASDGYVLTSDSDGIGTWQAPTGGGIAGSGTANYLSKFIDTTTIGDSVLYEKNNNIGIGTEDPETKLEVQGEVKSIVNGEEFYMVPKGAIIMWSGMLNDIPSGWQLCDGTNGTPDLRDRFLYGCSSGEDPGATGGSTSHKHDMRHRHTVDPPSTATSLSSGTSTGEYGLTATFAHSSHSHNVDISTFDSGYSNQWTLTETHLPPYYKIAYIMKL